MNYEIPLPITFGFFGALIGLLCGGCQAFPAWVGAATGCSFGCAVCVCQTFLPEFEPPLEEPVQTVVVENPCITNTSGEAKESNTNSNSTT